MSFSAQLRLRLEHELTAYCRRKEREQAKHGLKYRCRFRANSVTLIRTEPGFPGFPGSVDLNVAQMRYGETAKRWSFYCADRNGKWHHYFDSDPTPDIRELLRKIDDDPTGIFGS